MSRAGWASRASLVTWLDARVDHVATCRRLRCTRGSRALTFRGFLSFQDLEISAQQEQEQLSEQLEQLQEQLRVEKQHRAEADSDATKRAEVSDATPSVSQAMNDAKWNCV